MESQIKSSFIPKKPVVETVDSPKARYSSSGVDILMLISIVLVVIAGVLAVGVFLYKNLAVTDAANKKEQLEKARGAFDPALIAELTATSDRIRIAEGILEKHTAPSVLLESLEQDTLSGVQITELQYEQKTPEMAIVGLKGKSSSMNTVALQSSRFGENTIIKNPIFAGVDIVSDGVVFEVTGEINLNAIRYAAVAPLRGFAPNVQNVPLELENMGVFGAPGNPNNNGL